MSFLSSSYCNCRYLGSFFTNYITNPLQVFIVILWDLLIVYVFATHVPRYVREVRITPEDLEIYTFSKMYEVPLKEITKMTFLPLRISSSLIVVEQSGTKRIVTHVCGISNYHRFLKSLEQRTKIRIMKNWPREPWNI